MHGILTLKSDPDLIQPLNEAGSKRYGSLANLTIHPLVRLAGR